MKFSKKDFYVYVHYKKSDGAIFYIGKGKDDRYLSKYNRNQYWKNIVNKHGFKSKIIKKNMSEQCALVLEKIIIGMIGKEKLANLVDGGCGTSGWKHSDEARAKISAFNKGKKISQKSLEALIKRSKGKKLTEEHKKKLSDAKKGKPRPKLSLETRNKISASHIGIRPSKETLKKMSDAKKGKFIGKLSPSYDKKIRIFIHPDHGVFTGTRGDLIKKYNLQNGCVSSLINGKQKTVRGWRIA